MPRELEKQLEKVAKKKFPGDQERQDKYVYGAIANYDKKKNHRKKRRKK